MCGNLAIQLYQLHWSTKRYLKKQWYFSSLSNFHCFDRLLRFRTTVFTLIELIAVKVFKIVSFFTRIFLHYYSLWVRQFVWLLDFYTQRFTVFFFFFKPNFCIVSFCLCIFSFPTCLKNLEWWLNSVKKQLSTPGLSLPCGNRYIVWWVQRTPRSLHLINFCKLQGVADLNACSYASNAAKIERVWSS